MSRPAEFSGSDISRPVLFYLIERPADETVAEFRDWLDRWRVEVEQVMAGRPRN